MVVRLSSFRTARDKHKKDEKIFTGYLCPERHKVQSVLEMKRRSYYMNRNAERSMGDEAMIEELLQHLDSEFTQGVYRMSVSFDEKEEEAKKVSHKCCNMYGRPASETVGLLDMYTDISAGEPDRK